MHAVIRSYSGKGAKELFDLLEKRKAEVEGIMRGIEGFASYALVRTSEGGVSVTICRDKAGTDATRKAARDWVDKHASGLGTSPPVVAEGSVFLHAK